MGDNLSSLTTYLQAGLTLSRQAVRIISPHSCEKLRLTCADSNELPPQDIDWFYVRAAAVARHVYMVCRMPTATNT